MRNSKCEQDLCNTRELFDFLQGKIPPGITLRRKEIPRLTADQAWAVIWYMGNKYWKVSDAVERCGVCGDIYHSESSGFTLDYGRAPYRFCDECIRTEEFRKKTLLHPDPNTRKLARDGEWP